MNSELSPSTAPPGPDTPAASLTMVRVRRRRSMIEPSGKRGDLTRRPVSAAPAAPPPEPAAEPPPEALREPETILLLPAPPSPGEPEPDTPAPVDAEPAALAPEPPAAAVEPTLVLESALPAEEPEPEPAAAPAAAATDESRDIDEIIDYWDSLRGGRDFPSLDELDRGLVAATWPNSVLLAFGAAEADMPRISRLGEPDGAVEYTAMVTDWILSRGRQSAKRGQPMEEEQRFPISTGGARYRLLLLPFSSFGLTSDHVLCHVSRAEELSAVASLKRWLAF